MNVGAKLSKKDKISNVRHRLTKINDQANVIATGDLLGMELFYNTIDGGLTNSALFNGNISAIKWQTAQPTGITTPVTSGQKAYKSTYDKLNRLLTGDYCEKGSSAWDYTTKRYSENISNYINGKTYDLNGNIQGIIRNGLQYPNNVTGVIDKLKYYYDGNKLVAVDDSVYRNNGGDFVDNGMDYGQGDGVEYTYDKNGNLAKDQNKGILSITYNYLNQPLSITKSIGNRIEYKYDAAGTKRSQLYYINGTLSKTTDFYANFVYENSAPAWVTYDEGRVVLNSTGTAYCNEAYLKDHLGNVRVAFLRTSGTVQTRQVDSYYPFGMNIKGLTANSTDTYKPNEYLYNGKMMQDEMGLGWLDYGARFYDAVLGRWHSVDPLAQSRYYQSPYLFCSNNPILRIDIFGMQDTIILPPVTIVGQRPAPTLNPADLAMFFDNLSNKQNVPILPSPSPYGTIKYYTEIVGHFIEGAKFAHNMTGANIGSNRAVYGATFYGNGSVKILKLANKVKIGGVFISMIVLAADAKIAYDSQGSVQDAAVDQLVKDIVTTGVYAISAGAGILFTVGDVICNSPEMQKFQQDLRMEKEINNGIWQINTGPSSIGPKN